MLCPRTPDIFIFGSKTPFANTHVQGGAYSEIQTIALSNATSGQWRVAFNGEVSGPLSVGISAADLKTALDSFTGIDNVTVTGSSGSFTVTFGGSQAGVNVSQLFGDASSTSCGSTTQTITSSYNANDDLTAISDSNAMMSYTLDALGRTTAISNSIAGLTPSVTFNQSFNAAGLRTELKATIGSTLDFKNTYQYDTLGRMTELIQQGQSGGNAVTGKRATIAYNALNQRTLVSRFQSAGSTNAVATTEYSYDTLNRLSGLTHKQGTTTLAGYTYGYDGMSRLSSVTSTIEGLSTYSYDAGSQVVGADHAAGGQPDETYSFDANGNRNSSGYTTTSNNRTTAQPGFTYAYDDQGNRTSRTETATGKVTEYSWDHRNRLTTVKDRATSGGSVIKQVDYAYDAFNRLVKRTYDADGAGSGSATTQYWVYDEGINAVMQFDGSSSSNLSHRYLWTDAVDELMADEIVGTGADTQYALSDHLGTIRDIANFNESTSVTSVTNHRTYSSFGTLTAETNSAIDLIFGYTGKQLDDATGMQHNLFRWYDSSLGQWLSEDPLSFAAGDENLKRYVGNAGVSATDPTGLLEETTYLDALWDSYLDFVNPWDGSAPAVDGLDSVLSAGTMLFQAVGAGAAVAAGGVAVLGAIAPVSTGISLTSGHVMASITIRNVSHIRHLPGMKWVGKQVTCRGIGGHAEQLNFWNQLTKIPGFFPSKFHTTTCSSNCLLTSLAAIRRTFIGF